MATHILVYDAAKTPLGLMPDFTNLATMGQLNDTGVLSFSYLPNGVNVGLLNADVLYLSLLEDGVESATRWILDDDSDNTAADRAGSQMIKVTARGVLAITDTAVVYPKGHTPGGAVSGLTPEHEFKNQTPGAIFVELIRLAKNRGALTALEVGFTATHDSFGTPWPTQYTVTYAVGMKYLELLRAAADNGWFDMRMNGFELELAVPGGDLARQRPNVIFRNGQQVMSGPRKRSRRGIVTNMLGIGSEKNMVEVSDASQTSKFGRREGQASDGRMTEGGSLLAMTQHELERYKTAQEGFTLSVATTLPPGSAERWWIPGKDFREGDWIQWDQIRKSSTELEPLRVRSISYGYDDQNAPRTCEVELNDLFVERTLKLERQVQGIVQGSVTNAPPPTSDPGPDTTVPKPPPTLTAAPTVYAVAGTHRVSVALSWSATTENVDGSDYEDHDHYLVGWSTDRGTSWSPDSQVSEPYVWISDLTPGSPLDVRVKTRDASGNESDYTEFSVGDLPVDDVPPPRPSAPLVSTTLAVSTITWDGRAHDGAVMPPDFERVVCYTEGTEGSAEIEEYRGRWIQRGFALAGGDTPTGGALHLYAVTIAANTPQQTVLSSPAGASWGPVAVTLNAATASHALRLDVAGSVTQVNLATQGGVPFGQAFNLHLRAHRGRLVATVNSTQVADVALPVGADYLATNPVGVTGVTATEASVDLLTYYPAGHAQRVGTLGHDAAPSTLTIAGQEYERAYTVWFVAEDRDGNRSDPSEPTSFASKPLVDADLIGTTVRDALAQANDQLASIPAELESLNDDVEAARMSANGKSTVHYSTTAPAGTAHRVGDVWFDTANGNRISRWTGTEWTTALLAGPAMQDASITADKVLIGGTTNLMPDGYFARKEAWRNSAYVQATGGRISGGSFLIPMSATQAGEYIALSAAQLPYAIPVVEGQTYRLGGWVRFETAAPTAANRASIYARFWNPATNTFAGGSVVAQNPAGVAVDAWTWIEGTVKVPAGHTYLSVGCFKQAAHTVGPVRFDGIVVQSMTDGSLVVNGSITATHMLAGTITAESGIIGSIDAGKITVGELDGVRIKAGTITAQKLLVGGPGANLLPDARITTPAAYARGTGVVQNATGGRNGGGAFVVTSTAAIQDWTTAATAVDGTRPYLIPAQAGKRYVIEAAVRSTHFVDAAATHIQLVRYFYDSAGTSLGSGTLNFDTYIDPGMWITVRATTPAAPDGTAYVRVGGRVNAAMPLGAVVEWSDPACYLAVDNTLVVDGSITARALAAGTITADKIAGGTITGDKIKGGEITGDKLAANAITADKIKAGAIDGQLITGATIRTSATGWRMEMDDSSLRAYGGNAGDSVMTLDRSGITSNFADFLSVQAESVQLEDRLIIARAHNDQAATVPLDITQGADGAGMRLEITEDHPTYKSITALHLFGQSVERAKVTASIQLEDEYNSAGREALRIMAPLNHGFTPSRQGLIDLSAHDVRIDPAYGGIGRAVSMYRGEDWIPLTLQSGWSNYSGTATNAYAKAAYKIIGSIMIFRGLIKHSGTPASGDNIAYLGPSLVPPNTFGANIYSAPGNASEGEVQVNPMDYTTSANRGFLSYRKGLSGTSNWISLANVWYPLY
ncbi:hypothetical protein ACFCZ3_19580 [Cellulosimicrobium cellulans]|uniref:hypothetical protein n=1 Tax=Cellulosimicrobium cellulans TaxID=1710 RepID=UPI0035DC03E1